MKKVIIIMCSVTVAFCLAIGFIATLRVFTLEATDLHTLSPVDLTNLHIDEDGKININAATAEELTVLPGIGEVLANRIVSYREEHGFFKDVNDLLNISGIGEAKLGNIVDQIYVG